MSRAPTREQLLDVRRQARLVLYGKGLLEKKRDSLLRALEDDRRRFKEHEMLFKERLANLWQTFVRLQLLEGATAPWLLQPVPLRNMISRMESLMGCRFPVFDFDPETPFAAPTFDPALSSLYMDDLVGALMAVDELLSTWINMQARLLALEKELSRTLIKINTLEQTLLPELRYDEKRIRDVLSERERQERFALKKLTRNKKSADHSTEKYAGI